MAKLRLFSVLAVVLLLPACAVLETTGSILDILAPDPVPVCEEGAAGVWWDGEQCVKLSDGTYDWRADEKAD